MKVLYGEGVVTDSMNQCIYCNYNNDELLSSITNARGNTTSFSYDTVGNCIQKKTKFGQEDGKIHKYAYDAISQLVNVREEETRKAAYVFDPVGNRLVKETPNAALHYTHDAANEMITAEEVSFGYDKNGNMIRMLKPSENMPHEYHYDYAQRLEKVTFPDGREAEYNHNGHGHRMYKEVTGEGMTRYFWDPGVISGISQVLNEVDADDNPIADYFFGRGIVPLGVKIGGEYRYYLTDIQGSIMALADDDGVITDRYEYDEYGTRTSVFGTFPNSLGYTGQYHDEETGFIYLRSRYYDPSIGRFISRDPIGIAGGFSLYRYCDNNPINNLDPSGYFWGCFTACVAAAFFACMCSVRNLIACLALAGLAGFGCAILCGLLPGSW